MEESCYIMNSSIISLVVLMNLMLLKTTLANKCDAASYQVSRKVLRLHVIQSFPGTSSIVSCLDHCEDNLSCHSINWYSKTGLCQLNNGTHLSYPEGLVPDSTGRYMLYSLHPMVTCSNRFCGNGHVCLMEKDGINYHCQLGCNTTYALGMQDKRIQDAQITASSSWASKNVSHAPYNARLHSKLHAGAWCAQRNIAGEYLQIDLKTRHGISKVATQGRELFFSQWVKKYYLQYSQDGSNWKSYKYGGAVKNFQGNSDENSVVSHKLPPDSIILTRFIRFVVLEWHSHISMRVEIYGCDIP